jgi:uroporphyrinogen decarboxylase
MNKRDVLLGLKEGVSQAGYIPAAFFLHFDPVYHRGQAAVEKHLEYFHYTDMDFVKIQYEKGFPHLPEIQAPEDWGKMPFYKLDFYEEQLKVVEGLVKAAKAEALIVLTLYSPFMCAAHTASDALLTEHIRKDPANVKRGMEVITNSLMGFVKECVRLGVDGFYTSTQGGEARRFDDPASFDTAIRPYDLALMDEINRSCVFNILHVCDYQRPYQDISRFTGYPGHVVNASLELTGGLLTPRQVASQFGRPYMGGLERKGLIATGKTDDIKLAVRELIKQAPELFILGADCTVPSSTPWENLKTAISTAHHSLED